MRAFLREGELIVAEVQGIYQDGSAGLHTRSLKYGKLRNGVFLSVTGSGGSSPGVVRSRRQVWTFPTANNGGEIDIVLGVNGYIWICKHVADSAAADGGKVSITRIEESVTSEMYTARNEEIGAYTRREIARVAGGIRALVEGGVRVDEETVMRAYEAALEEYDEDGEGEGEASDYLGGERGRRVVAKTLAAVRAAKG